MLLLVAVGGEPPDETVVWQSVRAERWAAASGGIAEAPGARNRSRAKRIRQPLDKTRRNAAVSRFGMGVGTDGTLLHALRASQRYKDIALESLDGYGAWDRCEP